MTQKTPTEQMRGALELHASFVRFHIKGGACIDKNDKLYNLKDLEEAHKQALSLLNDCVVIRKSDVPNGLAISLKVVGEDKSQYAKQRRFEKDIWNAAALIEKQTENEND